MIGQYVNLSLNGELYCLAREDVSSRLIGSKRIWNVELKPKAIKQADRSDIQAGVLPDEFVCTYDDFSKGTCGYRKHIPGTCHSAFAKITEGKVSNLPAVATANLTTTLTGYLVGDMATIPTVLIEFNGNVYILTGKTIHRLAFGTATSIDTSAIHDNTIISDAVVFESVLYIAQCNGTVNTIAKMTTAEAVTDTMVTSSVYANFFAMVGEKLWKAYDGKVCSLNPGDNPMDSSKWGSEIEVGDSDKKITGLVGLGEKLYVCKEDGLFVGANDVSFTNVLPQFENIPNVVNGKGAKAFGTSIFYPHADGLIRYEPGLTIECGLQEEMSTKDNLGTSYYNCGSPPSNRINAMCSDSRGLWVATAPSFQLAKYPTKVLFNKTTGVTDVSSTVCNGIQSVGATPDVTTADYVNLILVGHDAYFWGIYLEIKTPTSKSAQLEKLVYSKADKSLGDLTVASDSGSVFAIDGTDRNGMFMQSGWIRWRMGASDWAVSDVTGWSATSLYWMGLNVDKGLTGSLTCEISEVLICVDAVDSHILRVLPADNKYGIRWVPFAAPKSELISPFPGYEAAVPFGETKAVLLTTRGSGGAPGSELLVEGSPTQVRFRRVGTADDCYNTAQSYVITGVDDFGIAEPKRIVDIAVKFKPLATATNTKTVSIYYRADEGAWTLCGSALTASGVITPTTPITATEIQFMAVLSAVEHWGTGTGYAGLYIHPTELYEFSVRYKVARGASDFKHEYTFYLEVGDNMYTKEGAPLPDGSVQITNLEALIGAGQITLLDPMGVSKTVTVDNIRQSELIQDGTDYPRLLVEVTASEV